MIRRPPRTTRTDTLCPYTTLVRSLEAIIESSDAHNLERKLEIAADALRLPPWEASIKVLSGGERRRVALCRLILSNPRSEEHTSVLQSLMRISYAVFCLKKQHFYAIHI